MEELFKAVDAELRSDKWVNTQNTVSDDYLKAVWKKDGDVGAWRFAVEWKEKEKPDEVLCLLDLTIGKRYAAKMWVLKKLIMSVGPELIMRNLKKSVQELVVDDRKGGYLCRIC